MGIFSFNGLLSFLECTANGQNCVFPFKYKGTEYNSCTKVESDNGKAWCALQLDSQGTVIPRKWADCDLNCQTQGSSPSSKKLRFFD